MSKPVFFSYIEDEVKKVLDERKKIYRELNYSDKSTNTHNWLVRKIAYAECKVKNSAGISKSLLLPTGGGLGTNSESLYVANSSGSSSSDSKNFLPKPHLTGVTISTSGDYGTIIKADIDFQVYTLAQLEDMQPFFDIKSEVEIDYGWNVPKGGTSAAGAPGKYFGYVVNFTWSLNSFGGFSCKVTCFGPGVNILSVDKNSKIPVNSVIKSEKGIVKKGDTLISSLELFAQNAKAKYDNEFKSVAIKWPETWESENSSGSNTSKSGTHVYVTLERLIIEINKMIKFNIPGIKLIRCDKEVTRGSVPKDVRYVSSDPKKVIFPGTKYVVNSKPYDFNLSSEQFARDYMAGDLSKILISVDWVYEIFQSIDEIVLNSSVTTVQTSISAVMKEIFEKIYDCSGSRYSLSVAEDPKTQNLPTKERQLLIADVNFLDQDLRNSEIYEFTAITQDSICRNVNLQSQLPAELATVAMVAASAREDKFFSGSETSPIRSNLSQVDLYKELDENIEALGSDYSYQNQAALKKTLKLLRHYTADKTTGTSKDTLLYPIVLTLTLDGISGMYFSNTITCNYLPSRYKTADGVPKVCFTILNVEHSIRDGDWTTTITTVCRLVLN